MNRAYSLLEIKAVNDETRTITGLATTPSPDRMGDVVESKGAKYKLPLPLLWQHDSKTPIGHVTDAKVTKNGIEIVATIAKGVSDEIDRAWTLIKSGLVRGLSIGFRGLDVEQIPNSFGVIFKSWEWLELSAVTIPTNSEATIQTIKQFDIGAPAAHGQTRSEGRVHPGATGFAASIKIPTGKGNTMSVKIGEQITALEETRKGKALRLEEIQSQASAAGRTKDENERKEFDTLRNEIKGLDLEITDLRDVEELHTVTTVKTVKATNTDEGTKSRSTVPAAVAKPKPEPGILFTQLIKARTISRVNIMPLDFVAKHMYGEDSLIYGTIVKANEVLPGTATSGNWGYDLISQEGAAVGDFVTYLRAQTIVGKFGQGNVPALNGSIRFYEPYVIQTGAGAGFWVGEAKTKPVTTFDYDRSTLTPLKMANITVLSNENIKRSDPKSDTLVRDALVEALVETEDTAFIDPTNSGTSNIKPAAVTNGADTIAATGTGDADDIVMDLRALFNKFDTANNDPTSGVVIMSPKNARAAGMLLNALGQVQFPTISANGGSIMSVPVIVSNHAGTNITMVNAKDIYYVDEGFMLDASDQVSLEMRSVPTQDGSVPTMTSMISMWQNNLVAFRAEKTVNWKKRRTTAVAYLTGAAWGGAVPES